MINLATQGLTHNQIKNALHSKSGTREISYRYDILRNGIKRGEAVVLSAQISFDKTQAIPRTAQFELKKDGIDWLKDTIKPHMRLKIATGYEVIVLTWDRFDNADYNWQALENKNLSWNDIESLKFGTIENYSYIDYPLGVFVLSTPTRNSNGANEFYDVEAYDGNIVLKEDCITDRLYYPAGMAYIAAITDILSSAGIVDSIMEPSAAVLPTDREFEIGQSKLNIINTLLAEINYNNICPNADGTYIVSKYVEPSASNIDYRYVDDELSVIGNNTTQTEDYYNVPNVYIAVVSNPEMEGVLKSVYINDSPASPLSTVQRGRKIVRQYNPDVIANQEELDAYVRKMAFESSQVNEDLTFSTAVMPIHDYGNVLEIVKGDINGVYAESGWSMELATGAEMEHTARRITQI